jgi:hypothetical protein
MMILSTNDRTTHGVGEVDLRRHREWWAPGPMSSVTT